MSWKLSRTVLGGGVSGNADSLLDQSIPGQKQKQPYYIQITDPEYLVDDSQFAFGGLWESSRRDEGEVAQSFTIITIPANELMTKVHNPKKRMSLILAKDAYKDWLAGSAEQAENCLEPYPFWNYGCLSFEYLR